MTGKFIVIDGPDGAGKTTLAMALAERIGAMLTREPRYAATRSLLFAEAAASPVELAIAMAHDRFQHLRHEVDPALQQGRTVVCDRYVLSTLAYQSEALAGIVGRDEVVGFLVLGAREPDLTIVVDVDPVTASARQSSKARDRFEDDAGLRSRVRARYLDLAERRGYPVINGQMGPQEVLDHATALFDNFMAGRRE